MTRSCPASTHRRIDPIRAGSRCRAPLVAATAALATVAAICAPAAAADQAISSPWSAATAISGSTRPAGTIPPAGGGAPSLAFAPSGRGVVSFAGGGLVVPVPPAPPTGSSFTLAAPIAADTVGAATELTPSPVTGIVAYGTDSLLAAVSPSGAPQRPAVAAGTIGGTLGTPRALGSLGQTLGALVANRRGDVAVLLESCPAPAPPGAGGCTSDRLAVVVRRAGGGFSRPVTLAGGANATTPAVAIGPTGDVVLAWAAGAGARSQMFARIRFASGRVGPVQTLGAALDAGRSAAALGSRDRGVVAWGTGYAGIDGATSPYTFRVALAGPGGRFGKAHTLDRWNVPGARTGTSIEVVLAGAGKALVAWQGHRGGHFTAAVARLTGTRVAARQVVSPAAADGNLASLASRPDGTALVLWSGPGGIQAAVAAPGQAFRPPEIVTAATDTDGASAAFDPVTGRAVAVWLAIDERNIGSSVRAAA